MSTDLKERAGSDADSTERSGDHIQAQYDDEFARLTNPSHYGKSAEESGGGSSEGSSDKKSLSSNSLFNKEANPNKPAGGSDAAGFGSSSLPNKIGGGTDGKGDFMQSARSRVGKLLKNKLLVGGTIFGSLSGGMIILLIIFVLGLFKIPNLAEHIISYQFARITRDYAIRSDNVNATKIGIDSADDSLHSRMKAKYEATRVGQAQGKAAEKWAQLDKYRPQKTIDNMQRDTKIKGDAKLKYNYEKTSILHRDQLKSITLEGKTVNIENLSFRQGLIPGYRFRTQSNFAEQFRPALRTSLASNDIGPLTRGIAMRKMRQQLGISLIAWHIDKLKGKSAKEARLIIEQDNYKEIKGNVEPNPKASDQIKEGVQEGNAAEQAAVDDRVQLQNLIDHPNETAPGVLAVLRQRFQESAMKGFLTGALGFVDPLYAIAAPLCLVYEGSLVNNGPTINKADAQSQRAFIKVAAAGSQVKDGYDTTGEAAGAFGAKLGNIEQSNPEKRAAGLAVNTSKNPSSQASPAGQFSIADTLPSPFDTVINDAATTCPIFTNIWVGVGLGVVNVVVAVLSVGTTTPAQGATEAAAQVAVKGITSRIFSKIVTVSAFSKSFAKNLIVTGGATAGATFLAQWIVLNQMGSAQTSPLASDKAFVDNADAGGNSHASNAERVMLRAAPLAKPEVALNSLADADFRADKVRSQSAFQRYLAVNNADSLANHLGSSVARQMDGSWADSILNLIRSVVDPTRNLAIVANAINPGRAMAATTDTYNYGNVQFGNTAEETRLIRTDTTYRDLLENQRILDVSGREDEIATRFGPCYDDKKGIGDLLTEETGEGGDNKYFIVRNDAGDVSATEGLCSQKNVGPHSAEYGDLVFRYRLAGGYDTTLVQQDEAQNPTETDAPLDGSTTATDPGSIPSGDAKALAQQILDSPNITFQTPGEETDFKQIAQTGAQNACGGPVPISPKLLGVILAASEKYKIVIGVVVIGHRCNNGFHPKGMAVDFNGVNPLSGSGGTGNRIDPPDFNLAIVKQFYGDIGNLLVKSGGGRLGQLSCFNGSVSQVSGIIYFPNEPCDHIHVDVGN